MRYKIRQTASTLRSLSYRALWVNALLLALALLTSGYALAATVIPYTTIPGAIKSTAFTSLTVNGTSIFVEHYKDVSYARFAFSGTVNIIVTSSQSISSFSIRPKSLGISGTKSGSILSFSLRNPQQLQVSINSLERLFIFADSLEVNPPRLGTAGVTNVLGYGVDKTGATTTTTQIQDAINAVNAAGGGVLYFPNGKYKTGTIKVKSNVTLYLQSGALIQGTSNTSNYPLDPGFTESPIGIDPSVPHPGDKLTYSRLIFFDGVSNAGIQGRGVIDGSGRTLRVNGRNANLIRIKNSRNIRVADVILRDSAAWCTHVLYSDNVTIEGIKILQDMTNINADGIDFDSTTRAVAKRVFSYSEDDCFAVKATNNSNLVKDATDLVFQNSICSTPHAAMKVGTETKNRLITRIWFHNIDVLRSARGFVITDADGATVNGVHLVDARLESASGKLMDISVIKRSGSGFIRNTEVINFGSTPTTSSTIYGLDSTHTVDNVDFMNLKTGGVVRTSLSGANISTNSYTKNVSFTTNGTPILYEAEGLTVYGSSGDAHTIQSEAGASGGEWVQYAGNAINDYVSYTLRGISAGAYVVRLGVKKYSSRGIIQWAVSSPGSSTYTNQGVIQDLYAPAARFMDLTLGSVTHGSTGDKVYRFMVTGKDKESRGYSIGIDYIKLIPQN